jgi:hypothetical protein
MDMKRSAEFNQLEERIWDLVGQEVMAMGGFAHLGQEALGRGDKDAGG